MYRQRHFLNIFFRAPRGDDDFFIAPPDLDLQIESDESTSLTSITCHLKRESIIELFDVLPEPTENLLLAALDVQDTRIQSLLLRLAEEARQPGFASQILVDSITTQLTVELMRRGTVVLDAQPHGGLAPWQLRPLHRRLRCAATD